MIGGENLNIMNILNTNESCSLRKINIHLQYTYARI